MLSRPIVPAVAEIENDVFAAIVKGVENVNTLLDKSDDTIDCPANINTSLAPKLMKSILLIWTSLLNEIVVVSLNAASKAEASSLVVPKLFMPNEVPLEFNCNVPLPVPVEVIETIVTDSPEISGTAKVPEETSSIRAPRPPVLVKTIVAP